MRDNTPDGSMLGSRERKRTKGRNGYVYVGKLDGNDIFRRPAFYDKLYKEVDHMYLVELTSEEWQRFNNQKLRVEK